MRGFAQTSFAPDIGSRFFAVAGLSGATAATANHFSCNLWNPSATRSLWLVEMHMEQDGQAAQVPLRCFNRSTTRGTAGSTVTPVSANDSGNELTPDTGAVLDMSTFSVQPTIAAGPLIRAQWVAGSSVVQGSSTTYILPGRGIRVPPGTGVGWTTETAVVFPTTRYYFVFYE